MTIDIGRMFSGGPYPGFQPHSGNPGFQPHFPDHKLLPSSFPEQKSHDQIDPLMNQLCRVCEEPAAGFHFGAFTCEGCKSFFGRTCNNQSVIQECKNSFRCVVDKKNRTACKACRLRKCLMVGMSKSGSRYGRRSNWFKIHCLMQQNLGKQNGGGGGSNPPPPPTLQLPTVSSHHSLYPQHLMVSSSRPQPPPLSLESCLPPTISWPPPPATHHHQALAGSPLSSVLASPLSSSLSPLSSPLKKEKSDCWSRSPSSSPSPLNVSTLSSPDSEVKSSPTEIEKPSPRKLIDLAGLSPTANSLGIPPTSLQNLYFPPPMPFLASNPFSFYRLSPLLATNPFLANSLYFQLAAASGGQKSSILSGDHDVLKPPTNADPSAEPLISSEKASLPGNVKEYQKSFQEHLRYLEMLKEKEFGPSEKNIDVDDEHEKVLPTTALLDVSKVKEELSPPPTSFSIDMISSPDDSRPVSPPQLLASQKQSLQIITESADHEKLALRHFESVEHQKLSTRHLESADTQKLAIRHLESADTQKMAVRHLESADQQKLAVRHLELLREHQTLLKAYSGLPVREGLTTGDSAMDLSVMKS